jgi:RNA recognition motif-containing protein
MTIYVGNVSLDAVQDDLLKLFSEYRTVKLVRLPTDPETGRLKGFGYVEMATEHEESMAIEALGGAEWMGRNLDVHKARPKPDRGSSGGSGGCWGTGGQNKVNG